MGKLPTNKPFEVTPTGLEPIPPEVESTFDTSDQTVLERFAGMKTGHASPYGTVAKALEPEVKELLSTRQATHGQFRDNARLSQHIKAVFRSTIGWEHLDDVEKESLDMIALKISRVLSGRSLERQHWEDVEGYARLVVNECDNKH